MKLNYYPIYFDFDEYQVYTEGYDEERLSNLRKEYNSTHSFFRDNEFIYISNKEGSDEFLLGTPVSRSVTGNPRVTSSLIKHIFFRTFKERFSSHTPVDFYPFRFFSEQEKDDIIRSLLPDQLKDVIAYKKLIEVQLRTTEIGGNPLFGFTINIRRNWIFDKSCKELHEEGFDLIGIDVLHTELLPGLDNVLAPNEEFVGIIKEIRGNTALVMAGDNEMNFPLDELTLKKTKFNISKYLTFAIGDSGSNRVLSLIESKRDEILNAKSQYIEVNKIARALFSEKMIPILFQNKDGFCFKVSEEPLEFENSISLKTPTFIFDHSATKTHQNNPDQGLTNFGPYDSISFDIKSPNILSICHGSTRGDFTKFLYNLKNGIPDSKYFKKGFLQKYDLQEVNFNIKEIQNYESSDYLSVIREDALEKPDLAIIEVPHNFRNLNYLDNPYYQLKAKLLSLEIPVQFVTTEIIKTNNEYILNSIGLQIYAKLGGTPWVLPSQRSVDRELIIGIGHSWVRSNQYSGSQINRVVGITTFLSGDGQYLLGDRVRDVSFEEYFQELLKSLKSSLDRLAKDQGWNEGDTVRLIFHIFKPIKNTEFDVVSELISSIPQYNIKFAFVTIGKNHPHLIFDPVQKGINQYGKGEFIPNRGSVVFLDSETALIQMIGPYQLKTTKQGMSNPIQIQIRVPQGKHENKILDVMLFYDLAYLSQQIFSFTYLSWRSFLPGEQPATMLYSNLISKLLSKLRNIGGWDSDKLNYSLKRKKWFL